MVTKNILLAIADPQAVEDVSKALGSEWAATAVACEKEALALLETDLYDALLADFNLGSSDASELLNVAAEKCPKITRLLLAYEADLALVAAKVTGSHEILPKPLDPASLRSRIENALNEATPEEAGTAAGFDTASNVPAIYGELLQALESPEVTTQQVGEMIARDDGLIQEALKLTRSSYMGLPRDVREPVDAVEILGLETVKALVLALRFMAEHSHVRPGYLSLEKIWQHSTQVALIARDLVLFETKDRVLASQALAAGLLHDLGKVVLATNYDDLYGRVHSLARKQPVALWEIEKEMFGANHGEIGACLLGMWNMPGALVDAAALHHEPPLGEHDRLTPLAAVHIANVLEQQLHPSDEFRVAPVVNTPFLNELGLLQRLPIWRATFATSRPKAAPHIATSADPFGWVAALLENGAASRTSNQLPGPTVTTQTATAAPTDSKPSKQPSTSRFQLGGWIFTGAIAGAMVGVAILIFGLNTDDATPVHARTLERHDPIELRTATQEVEMAPAPTPEEELTSAEPQEERALIAPEFVAPPFAVPPTVGGAARETARPTFRLNGIFFTVDRPSAIVNGQTVYLGEEISGAKVISISRDSVTLEINGEQKVVGVPGANGAF